MSWLGFLGNGRYVQANGLRCDVFLRFVGVLGDPGRYAQTDGLRCDVILWFMVGLFHMLKKCPFWREPWWAHKAGKRATQYVPGRLVR